MSVMNPIARLETIFQLSEGEPLFQLALHPKSCGGGDDFKFLALYGDAILNLLLLEHISKNDLKDSGYITVARHSFHNEQTLLDIAKQLQINDVMKIYHNATSTTKKDLKESIEALLGAVYLVKGLKPCKEIIKYLLQLAIDHKYLNPNPKGVLQILFQKKNKPLPNYISKRVGGPDHLQLFQTTITGEYDEINHIIQSAEFSSKKEAETEAAKLFLGKLGKSRLLEHSFFII